MSTDGQGRPLSDDGQWAWNGTEWVPAAIGGSVPVPVPEPEPEPEYDDFNATVITRSPFAREAAPSEVGQPAEPAQGYGFATSSPAARSSVFTPRIIAIAALVIIVVAAIVLIATLSSSQTKSEPTIPVGAYSCTQVGTAGTGRVTLQAGGHYTLSNGRSGSYTESGSRLAFTNGDLDQAVGVYAGDSHTIKITYKTFLLNCKAE